MKIIICAANTTKLSKDSLTSRPIGGADQALLRMIKGLGKHYEVFAYMNIEKETTENLVTYRPYHEILNEREADLLIVYRNNMELQDMKVKKKVFYSQDDVDAPCISSATAGYFESFDKVIVLSKYHKDRFKDIFEIPEDKFIIIGNAADKQHEIPFTRTQDFIYCSTPFRGLHILGIIWKDILKLYPNARLHVFSSMAIYDGQAMEVHFEELYRRLQTLDGVIYYGSKPQAEVLACMKICKLMLYPNVFPETYCNAIMEARACKTPFITSAKGALEETGGKAGVYVKGDPYDPEYRQRFVAAFVEVMENKQLYDDLTASCYPIRTWENWLVEIVIDLMETLELVKIK